MAESNIFGQNLAQFRQKAGWSQLEMRRRLEANGLKMHMTVLRRIEAGEREPRLAEAMKIAETMGITVELLTLDAASNKHLAAVSDSLVAFQETSRALKQATEAHEQAKTELGATITKARRAGVSERLLLEATELAGRHDPLYAG